MRDSCVADAGEQRRAARESRRRVTRTWGLIALMGCGCGTRDHPSLTVRIRTTEGRPVSAFLATLALDDGRVRTLGCPPEPDADAALPRCTDGGFEVHGSERPVEVTLRS